jgi:hypothetical protein
MKYLGVQTDSKLAFKEHMNWKKIAKKRFFLGRISRELKALMQDEILFIPENFFKMGDKKILLGKYPSYPGKTKITKVNFLMNFIRLPPRARTKK